MKDYPIMPPLPPPLKVYYGKDSEPFTIKKSKYELALNDLKIFQQHIKDIGGQSIQNEIDFPNALDILNIAHNSTKESVSITGLINERKECCGLGASTFKEHFKNLFEIIAPYGEGTFSYVEVRNETYRKHSFYGSLNTFKVIKPYIATMIAAIYDPNDEKSIKDLVRELIRGLIMSGKTSETEIVKFVHGAMVDRIMSA